MKKIVAVAVAVLTVGVFSSAHGAEGVFKLGGGVMKASGGLAMPGGGIGIDIHIPQQPAAVEVFADFYRRLGVNDILAGARFLYRGDVAEKKAEVYLGAGGGIGYQSNPIGLGSSTEGIATVVVGVNIKAGENVGVFVESQYLRSLTAGGSNIIALRAGLSFSISGR